MVTTLTVVPSVVPEWTADCLRTWKGGDVLIVDNSVDNIGVAASWNVGARRVIEDHLDYLVILSAGVRFGPPGGRDFFSALEERPRWGVEADGDLGWHLVAFSRELLELVGLFDENYWPAYWEDNDFSYRVQLATDTRGGGAWTKTPVRASLAGKAHGILYGHVPVDFPALEGYFSRKWGGPSACEAYEHPFDRADRPLSWWPTDDDPELTEVEIEPGDRLLCPECRDVLIEGIPDAHGTLSLSDSVQCCLDFPVLAKHMIKQVVECS